MKVDSFDKHTFNLSFNDTCIIVSTGDTSFSLRYSHGCDDITGNEVELEGNTFKVAAY